MDSILKYLDTSSALYQIPQGLSITNLSQETGHLGSSLDQSLSSSESTGSPHFLE